MKNTTDEVKNLRNKEITEKRISPEKICVNPCKSMRKIINEKNLRHLQNLRDKLIFSEKKKTAEKKKLRGKKNKKSLRNLSKSEALH